MIDPDELAEERRRKAMPAPVAEPEPPSPGQAATAALLSRLREGDELAAAHRWLSIVRGDRRPCTVFELDHAIAELAADENVDVEAIRAGLDRVLADAGGIAAWEERLRRPRRGRVSLDARDATPLTPYAVRQRLKRAEGDA